MRRIYKDHRWQWRKAFEAVMARYEKARTKAISNGVANIYVHMESQGRSRTKKGHSIRSTRYSVKMVKPSDSDFICDVENTARHTLRPFDAAVFKIIYVEGRYILQRVRRSDWFRWTKQRISEQLGKAFMARGLWPTYRYFAPRDLRGAHSVRSRPAPFSQAVSPPVRERATAAVTASL